MAGNGASDNQHPGNPTRMYTKVRSTELNDMDYRNSRKYLQVQSTVQVQEIRVKFNIILFVVILQFTCGGARRTCEVMPRRRIQCGEPYISQTRCKIR